MKPTKLQIQKDLRKKASPKRAKSSSWYFKTGKGEYGEGDVFIGVSVPDVRMIVKKNLSINLGVVTQLLTAHVHEERLFALITLVEKFKKADELEQQKIFKLYIKLKRHINNWDLVDTSSPSILGQYSILQNNFKQMDRLVTSKRHWDRRMAVLGTLALIRRGDTDKTFEYAKILLTDPEDLMHKAVGWMLREAGKKDEKKLRLFLKKHGKSMPRTMLRYAIERFAAEERKEILKSTRIINKS